MAEGTGPGSNVLQGKALDSSKIDESVAATPELRIACAQRQTWRHVDPKRPQQDLEMLSASHLGEISLEFRHDEEPPAQQL